MRKVWLFAALIAGLAFTGCSSDSDADNETGNGSSEWIEDDPDDYADHATFDKRVEIRYDGASAEVTVPSQAIAVTCDGAHVTVDAATNAVEGMEIVLKGESDDGSLKVYAAKKYKLTLSGVTLRSRRGAAVNNQSKKRTFVCLAPGTENTLGDAAAYDDLISGEDCKGCLFSEGQLLFSGAGALKVESRAKHGIVSDEYVRVFEGDLSVAAGKDAVHANDYVRIDGGNLYLVASSDGIECERGFIHQVGGRVRVECGGDGLKASGKAAGDHDFLVKISGGQLELLCDGEKAKGVEAAQEILVSGGALTVRMTGAAGKCLKAGGMVTIKGGTLSLTADGDALFDSGETSSAACIRSDAGVSVQGGTTQCMATGEGGKGINAAQLSVSGGSVAVVTRGAAFESGGLKSSPKGVKVDDDVNVCGGWIASVSEQDDAIAAAGSISVESGRAIAVSGARAKAFVCGGTFAVKGGLVIGAGGDTDFPSASASQQPSVVYRGLQAADQELIHVSRADATAVLTFGAPLPLDIRTLLFSVETLTEGTYRLSTGGSYSGGEQWMGYRTGGTYTGGTLRRTFDVSGMLTQTQE